MAQKNPLSNLTKFTWFNMAHQNTELQNIVKGILVDDNHGVREKWEKIRRKNN